MKSVITEELKKVFFKSFIFDKMNNLEKDDENLLTEHAETFEKGECVYSEKSFKRAVGIIVDGKVRVTTVNKENSIVLKDMGKTDVFGAAAVFSDSDGYVSEIYAKTACTVVFVSEEKLRYLFSKYPESAINYISFLSSKITYLNSRISELSAKGADAKILDYMTKKADENGFVSIPKNMSLLAKSLGIGRSSLYRAFDALENDGFIIRNNDKWKITKEK